MNHAEYSEACERLTRRLESLIRLSIDPAATPAEKKSAKKRIEELQKKHRPSTTGRLYKPTGHRLWVDAYTEALASVMGLKKGE